MLLMMALAHSNYLISMTRMMPWSNQLCRHGWQAAIGSGRMLSSGLGPRRTYKNTAWLP